MSQDLKALITRYVQGRDAFTAEELQKHLVVTERAAAACERAAREFEESVASKDALAVTAIKALQASVTLADYTAQVAAMATMVQHNRIIELGAGVRVLPAGGPPTGQEQGGRLN